MSDTGQHVASGTLDGVDPEILHLDPATREERGITDEEVREAFLAVVRAGDRDHKDLQGITLPHISLDRQTVEGTDNHPIDLRDATIAGLSAAFATVRVPLRLDGATIGDLTLNNAHFKGGFECPGATVTGEVDAFEARFDGDVDLTDATFEAPTQFEETIFDNDVAFDRATFEAPVAFRLAEFHGDSNLLEDNTSFIGATFADTVDFRQAEFGFMHFEDTTFEAEANFEEVAFTGDVDFPGAVFRDLADFDETRFGDDADFSDTEFHGVADFRGAIFEGGQRALEADLTFEGSVFEDVADFGQTRFRAGVFTDAQFRSEANFQEAVFDDDATFAGVRVDGLADFDEARFRADADFSDARFESRCDFRGAEFSGGDNHLEEDASFAGVHFVADADFQNTQFTSASFTDTAFGGEINFAGSTFADRIDFEATQVDNDAFVDFSGAKIHSGRIAQPREGWVRYDLTLASIGDIDLVAARPEDGRQILDYFRFCRTEFDEFSDHEFEFSDHRDYLDRNGWVLHAFDEPPGAEMEYALEMTPEVIETTYLKAKQSAAEAGNMKVAGEFRVKRQQWSRHKNMEVVRDQSAGLWPRVKNFGRVTENYFLGVTCGHGMRPIRIGFAFLLAPLFYVPLYALGGSIPLFETTVHTDTGQSGAALLFDLARFSYVSYTTIGYGFIGPVGEAAEVLAASEAYVSTILAALLVYALVKRSEL